MQEPPPLVDRSTAWSWLALATTLLAAVLVRFYGFDHLPGINGDEPAYPVHVAEWFHGQSITAQRTGTGLLMNPPFFGMVVLLQLMAAHTLSTLRLSAVLYSLLAIALAFLLFRHRGRSFAATFAVLVATLPIHLGYGRLAWDPAAVPTMIVIALAAATALRPAATLLAFALGVWVHPTTGFCLPILVSPFVVAHWPRGQDGRLRRPSARALWVFGIGSLLLIVSLLVLLTHDALPAVMLRALHGRRLIAALGRAHDPLKALSFAGGYVNLISGATIYRYFVGSMSEWSADLHFACTLGLLLGLTVAGTRALARAGRSSDLAMVWATLLSLVLAYLVGGPILVRPGTERYALFVTVPSCYVLASFVDVLGSTPRRARAYRWGTAVLGALCVASFSVNCLAMLKHENPGRADTFRTGDVDPKQRATEAILRLRDPAKITIVQTEDWWIYWTVRYLLPPEKGARVTIPTQRMDYRFPRDFVLPAFDAAHMEAFGIAWTGSPMDDKFQAHAQSRSDVFGYETKPILHVYRLRSLEPAVGLPIGRP